MAALQKWNGGVIVISHDERFITTVANEVSSITVPVINCSQLTDFCEAVGMRRWDGHKIQRRCSKLQGLRLFISHRYSVDLVVL
jgi:hypothetical protein